ncbi:zinc ABC transporter substrate-binding protein [Maritimibacter sp. DP1N21-5]|nr:zinc ABC transporter substrate-binding protein [Maritimibacter sp. DP1N21-5]
MATPVFADAPRVVTDIAPVHSLVSQVMAGVAEPQLLLDGSADPHSVQLKPSQARGLTEADLVIWMGEDLEPWLARLVANLSEGQSIELLEHPSTHLRSLAEAHDGTADHDDHDDHTEEADHDDHAHEHEHDGADPHAWLAPENAAAWVKVIAEELARRDAENADTYRANADTAVAAIEAQATEITTRLAPYEGAEIITFHDAFGYFTDAFGIEVLGSVRPSDASSPSAAAVDALRMAVEEQGVSCAFAEPNHDPALLEALASETGLTLGTLDATGALVPAGPGLYAALIENLATSLETCLSGN